MFFVLWMVGLIVVSIELWGPSGSVSSNCNLLVFNAVPNPANDMTNLAWLAQKSICECFPSESMRDMCERDADASYPTGQSWQAAFSFALVGVIFLLWIMVMAIQVFYDDA
jgi:hypothetical protein